MEAPYNNEKQNMKKFDKLNFTCKEEQSEIHGFGGYFTAELYKDVVYSTHPQTHTPGMHSWFPMFFPIREPMFVKKN
jgi:protein arginine N-methyltransferase 5